MSLIQRLNRLFYRPSGGPLPDWRIAELVKKCGMIEPFYPEKINKLNGRPAMSFGLDHYGYCLTLSKGDFRVFKTLPDGVVMDPKNFDPDWLESPEHHSDHTGEYFIIPPNNCALGFSPERLSIPSNVVVHFIPKSSYARVGGVPHVTPAEPGWEGYLTLEISNTTPNPVKFYTGEGIVQAVFYEGYRPDVTYGNGKYQGQKAGVTLARV